VNVIRPHTGSRTYTIVLHFDALEHLEQWLASEVWNRLILKVQHLLQDGDQVEIKTGLEFWFRPPDSEQKPFNFDITGSEGRFGFNVHMRGPVFAGTFRF